jgi:DNA-binding transcriptional ArsR family regulator
VSQIPHPAIEAVPLVDVLQALGDPVRLEIVHCIHRDGEVCCGSLEVTVSKSTLSHHLKVLRQAGITRTRRVGTQRFVSLRDDELHERFPALLATIVDCAAPAA